MPDIATVRESHRDLTDFDTFPAPREDRVKVELTPVRVVANG